MTQRCVLWSQVVVVAGCLPGEYNNLLCTVLAFVFDTSFQCFHCILRHLGLPDHPVTQTQLVS